MSRDTKYIGMDVHKEAIVIPRQIAVIQSGGWTALYRIRFLQIAWTMDIQP